MSQKKYYVLAIDQGTTSSRAIIYNSLFKTVASHSQVFPQHFPTADRVEHDLSEIWSSVKSSVVGAVKKAAELDPEFSAEKLLCIGITNQRETFGVWNKQTHQPVAPAIVWQCRRSAPLCQKLRKTTAGKKLAKLTGLVLDPYFSGTKLAWFFKENPTLLSHAKSGELAFGNIDTFLIWKLSNGESHKTDVSNASRTMLMDLAKCRWSAEALKTLGLPATLLNNGFLPEITDSDGFFGVTRGLDFLPDNIPISGVLGDQQAALFGQECFNVGEGKSTYGTGAFILVNTGPKLKRSKNALSTVAWTLQGKTSYALEASVFIAGAAVSWLRDGLGIIKASSEMEALASTVPDSDGVFFIPALSGLGSPHWRPEARGLIGGLSRRSNKAHIVRACLEGIASSIGDVFEGIEKDSGKKLRELRVDGGATANNLLLQMQADFIQANVVRRVDLESTARGAAYMAALGSGLVQSLVDVIGKNPIERSFKPQIKSTQSKQLKQVWRRRVQGLMGGAY